MGTLQPTSSDDRSTSRCPEPPDLDLGRILTSEAGARTTATKGYRSLLQEYILGEGDTLRSMVIAVESIDHRLRVLATALPSDNWALAARGSYARGDLAPHSDIDLYLINASKSVPDCLRNWPTLLGDHRVAIQYFESRPTEALFYELPFCFAVTQMRFIAGDRLIYRDFFEEATRRLAACRPDHLAGLFRNDIHRPRSFANPQSRHYHDLKRGAGGSIDYEWIKLASYQRLLNHVAGTDQQVLECRSSQFFRYLSSLKSYLHMHSGGRLESTYLLYSPPYRTDGTQVPWYFSPRIIDQVRQAQHSIANRFATSMSGREALCSTA